MKNSTAKVFKKKTNRIHSFNHFSGNSFMGTTIGDPTNTIITTLTTASGQSHMLKPVRRPLSDGLDY
jgi:hypothetical protein